MTWEQTPVPAPVLDGVKSIASAIGGVTQSLEGVLGVLLDALNVAKAFFISTSDPLSALFQSLLTELENLINDLFTAGIYQLPVLPTKVGNTATETVVFNLSGDFAQDPDVETLKLLVKNKNKEFTHDNFGVKLMTPSQCVDHMINSFNDQGDTSRPIFSASSQVCAMGFIVTAPTLEGFLPLLQPLGDILGIQAFLDIYNKFNDQKTPAADLPLPPSVAPDWNNTLTLSTFKVLKDQRDVLIKALGIVRGYTENADSPIKDLVDVLERKLKSLSALVSQFNSLIATLESAVAASGVYTFNYAPTVGGVAALQAALRVNNFDDLSQNGYTVGILYVGGGPSLSSVDVIRQLVLGS